MQLPANLHSWAVHLQSNWIWVIQRGKERKVKQQKKVQGKILRKTFKKESIEKHESAQDDTIQMLSQEGQARFLEGLKPLENMKPEILKVNLQNDEGFRAGSFENCLPNILNSWEF